MSATDGRHAADSRREPGELLVRVGAAVFGVGVFAVLVALGGFLIAGRSVGWAAVLATLMPVGLGLALLGLLRGARRRR